MLFRHVSRIARDLGARSVMIENVPGVQRVNGVSYTTRITASLREAGYTTWDQPATLRASDFGVPQNRRRLFFVGVEPGVPLPARAATPSRAVILARGPLSPAGGRRRRRRRHSDTRRGPSRVT